MAQPNDPGGSSSEGSKKSSPRVPPQDADPSAASAESNGSEPLPPAMPQMLEQKPSTGKIIGRPPAAVRAYFTNRGDKNPSTKRYDASCNLCGHVITSARQETMAKHILHCSRATAEIKAEVSEEMANKSSEKEKTGKAGGAGSGGTGKAPSTKGQKRAREEGAKATVTGGSSTGAPSTGSGGNKPLAKTAAQQVDVKLLQWLVTSGVPFTAVDSPFFKDFVHSVSGGRCTPADSRALRVDLLPKECTAITALQREQLQHAIDVTVTIGAWSDASSYSHLVSSASTGASGSSSNRFGCLAVTPARTVQFVSLHELPVEPHSTQRLTEAFAAAVDKVGAAKVAAITTDNSSSTAAVAAGNAASALLRAPAVADMTAASLALTRLPAYAHIVNVKCMVQGFAGCFGSVLGHPFALSLLNDAMTVVSHFTANTGVSNRLSTLLYAAAKDSGITAVLELCTFTHCTSVHRFLASVSQLETAFKAVLKQNPKLLQTSANTTVVQQIISSDPFWRKLGALCALLQPFTQALDAVEQQLTAAVTGAGAAAGSSSSSAAGMTIADVTRQWVYLARRLAVVMQSTSTDQCLDVGFVQHVVVAYRRRVQEQLDTRLSRLALFLDPRFKLAAVSSGGGATDKELVQEACDIMQKRRWKAGDLQRLVQQITEYRNGATPFDTAHSGPAFTVRNWWSSLPSVTTAAAAAAAAAVAAAGGASSSSANSSRVSAVATDMITHLALLLLDIVPHTASADPKHAVSMGKWFGRSEQQQQVSSGTGRSGNALDSDTALAATKLHYMQRVPVIANTEASKPLKKQKQRATAAATAKQQQQQQQLLLQQSASVHDIKAESGLELLSESVSEQQNAAAQQSYIAASSDLTVDQLVTALGQCYNRDTQSAGYAVAAAMHSGLGSSNNISTSAAGGSARTPAAALLNSWAGLDVTGLEIIEMAQAQANTISAAQLAAHGGGGGSSSSAATAAAAAAAALVPPLPTSSSIPGGYDFSSAWDPTSPTGLAQHAMPTIASAISSAVNNSSSASSTTSGKGGAAARKRKIQGV